MSRALNHHAGAYLVNSGYGAFPIFCSMYDFVDWGMDNVDDYYIVMPGYKLLLYVNSSLDDSTSYPIDNTIGTTVLYQTSPSINQITSCKLYFGGFQITS